MDWTMIGKPLQMVAGVTQSMIDRKTDQLNIQRQFQANKGLSEYQYSKDLEMWNRQNEYNSPKMQMERFKNAGLNPNLMYQQGSTGNATTLPKYSAIETNVKRQPLQILPIISAYQDMALKTAQIDNVKSQNRVINANATIQEAAAKFAYSIQESRLYEQRKRGLISAVEYENKLSELSADWSKSFNSPSWREGNLLGDILSESEEPAYQKRMREIREQAGKKGLSLQDANLEKIRETRNTIKLQGAKFQGDIELQDLLKRIRTKEAEFGESGGKFYNSFIQFLKLILGSEGI